MSLSFCSEIMLSESVSGPFTKGLCFDISGYNHPIIYTKSITDGKIGFFHLKSIAKNPAITYSENQKNFPKYLLNWFNIHENQFEAGQEIVRHFFTGTSRYVILIAQMQSGKTGTAKYVVHCLTHCSGNLGINPAEIYFICGMNDNDLRDQAIKEFKDLIPPERILFSKQLQSFTHEKKKCKPSLIIVDESHYASACRSQIDQFFKECVDKQNPDDEDPYILSVSATPMAEIATSAKYGKAVVRLLPGPDYYGIRDIFCDNLIFPSINITTNMEKFVDLVADEYEEQQANGWKYNIVRLPSQWYYKDVEDQLEELELDIEFINHHSQFSTVTDFNDYLAKEPKKMVIIWIYNSLRAGKQLNTSNIGFVHDTSSSKPDTIAQALLGRILGYGKANNGVRCYTDISAAMGMLEWVNASYDMCYIPQGSKAIIGGYTDKVVRWKLHPPIMVELPIPYQTYYRDKKEEFGNRYPYKDDVIIDLVDVAIGDDVAVLERVLENYTPGKHGGLMVLTEHNADTSLRDHWNHNYECYKKGRPTRGFEADPSTGDKFYYIFMNLNRFSEDYGKVLVVYKELINDKTEADYVIVNPKSRFA